MVDLLRDGSVFYTLAAGDSAGFMQSTLQYLFIFRDHNGILIIMLVWLVVLIYSTL